MWQGECIGITHIRELLSGRRVSLLTVIFVVVLALGVTEVVFVVSLTGPNLRRR